MGSIPTMTIFYDYRKDSVLFNLNFLILYFFTMSFSDSDDDILSTKVKSFNIAPEDRKHMSMVRDDFVRADLDVFLFAYHL